MLGGAVGVNHPRTHVVNRDEGRDRRVGDRQFLEDPNSIQPAQPAAADVFSAVDGSHAQLRGLAHHVDGEVFVVIPLQCVRCDAFGRECGGGLRNHPLVIIECHECHYGPLYFIVGMTNSAPSLMPDGQRSVTVFTLV